MRFESNGSETYHRRLHLIVLFGALSLLPFNTCAEEDTVQRTQNSSHDVEPTESPHIVLSLVGDHATPFDHHVALYETLTQIDVDGLEELLRDSIDITFDSMRDETLIAIASRFAEIDPQKALAKFNELVEHERDPFLKGIFSEWCVSNLDEAISAAKKLNRHERLSVLTVIVHVRDDLTTAQLNAIAGELGHPDYASRFESQMKTIEFADDPISAWSVLVHDGLDDMSQLDTFVQIAESLVEEQGFDALFHLHHEPFEMGARIIGEIYIADRVFDVLAKNDPENTWEYIQHGSSRSLDQSLGKDQAQDQNTFSLRDRAYMTDRVQRRLMRSWADTYPEMTLAEIEQIPHHLQPLACERALASLVTTDSERTVELIQSLSLYGGSSDATLMEVVRRWSATDPAATLDWVLSASEMDNVSSYDPSRWPTNKEYIERTVLESLVLEDPKRAIEVAVLHDDASYLEAWIVGKLAASDTESALEVLPLVSESSKSIATGRVAAELARRGEIERGMELLLQYEKTSGEKASEVSWVHFFYGWVGYNAVQLFDRLDELEPRLRTVAAGALDYIFLPSLTQEQLDYVRSILDSQTE